VESIRIPAARIADAIALIDAFRAAGLDARLADVAGAWDVEVAGSAEALAAALSARTRRWASPPAVRLPMRGTRRVAAGLRPAA
jgi:hypothetical protein